MGWLIAIGVVAYLAAGVFTFGAMERGRTDGFEVLDVLGGYLVTVLWPLFIVICCVQTLVGWFEDIPWDRVLKRFRYVWRPLAEIYRIGGRFGQWISNLVG